MSVQGAAKLPQRQMQVGSAKSAAGLKQQKPQASGRLGSLDADLGFRASVMAAAGMQRQGSAGRPLQEVGNQVAERPPLLIGAVLQSLRKAPGKGGADPGGLAPHHVDSSLQAPTGLGE